MNVNSIINTISQSGYTLSADQANATYQWLNCNGGINTIIAGATNQTYIVTANGDYSVEVFNGSCTDTSSCLNVMGVGINDQNMQLENSISIYPNPSDGNFNIKISDDRNLDYQIIVRNLNGKVVYRGGVKSKISKIELRLNSGFYFVELIQDNHKVVKRLIVR